MAVVAAALRHEKTRSTMSIQSLAIVGKDNKHLYLKEFSQEGVVQDEQEELFGFSSLSSDTSETTRECSLRQEFILHAALDRFEELAGPPPGVAWRTSGVTGMDAMWVGLLCPVEEMRVYGYVTTTKIKLIVVVQDDILPDQTQMQIAKDSEIKELLETIHILYVEYIMNPFHNIHAEQRIESKRFHQGVEEAVFAFNSEVQLA